MTQESIQPVLDWINMHPTWSGFIVFLISLSESLAIVGLAVPGVVLMTAIGGMMGAGVLPFWQTLLWAILGAIAGDGISYWLGYHYHEHLRDFWPFKQFPQLLVRGEAFFKQHGGKSIVFGRFVGPVRPMIPVIAGMMDMTPKRFLFFNILSAIVWAPLYSLPGILIGASLGTLSSEVASRLGLLVLLVLLALWVIYEILLLIGAWIIATLKKFINAVWKILNRLSWLPILLRTAQGTEQNQLGIILLFLAGILGFILTSYGVLYSEGIANWNEPVYQVLRALYSDKWITTVALLTGLGDPLVLVPTVLIVGIWFFWCKRFKVAYCWLITSFIGYLIGYFTKIGTAIPRPEGLLYSSNQYAFPSTHTLVATLTFGLSSAFIQHALSPNHRWIPWAISIPLIFIVAFSRLYLGMHWFTDIIGSLSLGIAIVALGTLIYRRIERKPIAIPMLLVPGIIVIGIMFSFYTTISYPEIRRELVRQWPIQELNEKMWWEGNKFTHDFYRSGAFKHHATVLDIQWLGDLKSVQTILEQIGWKTIPKLNFKTGVMLLANNPPPLLFPVMPKFHRDRLPVLTIAKTIHSEQRLVLQLWQSDYLTTKKTSLWVGTLRLETPTHPLPLVVLYLEHPYPGDILKGFAKELSKDPAVRIKTMTFKNTNMHKILLIKSP